LDKLTSLFCQIVKFVEDKSFIFFDARRANRGLVVIMRENQTIATKTEDTAMPVEFGNFYLFS
jgi:hypothetical protein